MAETKTRPVLAAYACEFATDFRKVMMRPRFRKLSALIMQFKDILSNYFKNAVSRLRVFNDEAVQLANAFEVAASLGHHGTRVRLH